MLYKAWSMQSLDEGSCLAVPTHFHTKGFTNIDSPDAYPQLMLANRTNKVHWFAVVNPQSANGSTLKRWPMYHKKLADAGYWLEYEYTTGPKNATEITRRLLQDGYTHIIAVGGDGTINEVVNGFYLDGQIINPEAELAFFSHGTGGDLIRTLMFPKGIDGFMSILSRCTKRRLDVGEVQFRNEQGNQETRYFINVADVGLGGETVARVNRQSKFLGGKLSFLIGSIISIFRYRNKVMHCEIDGKLIYEGRLNSIMVANGKYIGGGMMIAPQAEVDDGFFDVVCLGDFSALTLLRHLPKIYRGSHLKIPGVNVYRGRTIVITTVETTLLDVDGEQPGQTPITFLLHSKALKIWG